MSASPSISGIREKARRLLHRLRDTLRVTSNNDSERMPIGYIGDVRLDHWPEPERAILHSREGNKVYLRAADPCDPETERVPVYEGDEVIVMEHIAYTGIHAEPEGADGYMLSLRVVPVREEPGKVIARTLRYGEEDDGRRAHFRLGDTFVLEDVQISIDFVDDWEARGADGYVPLTPVLFTWMSFGQHHSAEKHRYLLAAARRLDQAQTLFERIDVLRQSDPEGAPAIRRAVFELVGTTELAIVSLGRVVDMCMQARTAIGATTPVPAAIRTRCEAVRAIRNAYEHIEDRAVGNVNGRPHPNALTIFNHQRVVVDGVIEYGTYQLDLSAEVPSIVDAARQYLKDVAKEF